MKHARVITLKSYDVSSLWMFHIFLIENDEEFRQ